MEHRVSGSAVLFVLSGLYTCSSCSKGKYAFMLMLDVKASSCTRCTERSFLVIFLVFYFPSK